MHFTATWKYVSGWSWCNPTSVSSNIGTQTKTQSCVNADYTTADGLCAGEPETDTNSCISKLNVNCIKRVVFKGVCICNLKS